MPIQTKSNDLLSLTCACNTQYILLSFTVTPLDVVKTRLQTQQKRMTSNKCFVYCNGLMDHLCPCPNGMKTLKTQSTHYTGMIVRTVNLII